MQEPSSGSYCPGAHPVVPAAVVGTGVGVGMEMGICVGPGVGDEPVRCWVSDGVGMEIGNCVGPSVGVEPATLLAERMHARTQMMFAAAQLRVAAMPLLRKKGGTDAQNIGGDGKDGCRDPYCRGSSLQLTSVNMVGQMKWEKCTTAYVFFAASVIFSLGPGPRGASTTSSFSPADLGGCFFAGIRVPAMQLTELAKVPNLAGQRRRNHRSGDTDKDDGSSKAPLDLAWRRS